VGMPRHNLPQPLLGTATLNDGQGSGHDGRGSAHTRSRIDQGRDVVLQQGCHGLDRHPQSYFVIRRAVHQRKVAIDYATRQRGRRLLRSKVDDRHK